MIHRLFYIRNCVRFPRGQTQKSYTHHTQVIHCKNNVLNFRQKFSGLYLVACSHGLDDLAVAKRVQLRSTLTTPSTLALAEAVKTFNATVHESAHPEAADRSLSHHTASTSTTSTHSSPHPIPSSKLSAELVPEPVTSGSTGSLEGPTCLRCTLRGLNGDVADALSDILLGMVAEEGSAWGVQSVVVSENRTAGRPEQEIFFDGNGSCELWDVCDVEVHLALEADPRKVMEAVSEQLLAEGFDLNTMTTTSASLLPSGSRVTAGNEQFEILSSDAPGRSSSLLLYNVEEVANEAWVEQIKASYIPIKISPTLYIVPEWSTPEDPTAVNIILQPGVAFGTGEHPTTRLCLLALEHLDLKGTIVMDYGAGSGVLALAALHLGATAAVGVDTDSLAVRAARRNAQLNGVEENLAVLLCGPSLEDSEPLEEAGFPASATTAFDVVVANILRGPLVELQPRLTAYCKSPGGIILLSGILTEQVPEVLAAYKSEFSSFQISSDGSWASIQARRS
ncbi:hypothetical protein CEUSTIGMA_g7655.t1 [Chlamydomonas eustigma]|uniref:ETFB lysine methyltransferase n=1 Tax=Chlamydomonas eustigma TaxID=1157962 RepID=A0A250XAW4_9CHLO|nr:hypothetical protein CEUSTIGMA_g7655.t1 [Chlamydomonas eustigma]|eukprot:GAX80217.1 hypothetical protein CEUSTIGMA_g7655.t1 [Chlamydomonas eustigma]